LLPAKPGQVADLFYDFRKVSPMSFSMNRRKFFSLFPSGAAFAAQKVQISATRATAHSVPSFELDEITIDDLSRGMQTGRYTARRIAQLYLARIEATNRRGPMLRAVIETNPDAIEIAESLDAERKQGKIRGPMHGIPVLLKANIGTADKTHTSAGSLALAEWSPPKDAFIAARLRESGAVLLGKTNLSEWAGARGLGRISGWSGVGGQTRNPYVLDRNPQGSSSGSGVAVAANLCSVAVGTDTGGSITYPAAANGIVGLRPTLGLLSRSGIIPLSLIRDTAGPMGRTVRDVAIILAALQGVDPEDPLTTPNRPELPADYTRFLDAGGLKGARLVVAREFFGAHAVRDKVIEDAMKVMRDQGAELFDQPDGLSTTPYQDESRILGNHDMKAQLNRYLSQLPEHFPVRTLAQLVEFNNRNADRELQFFSQSNLESAEKAPPVSEERYIEARDKCWRLSRDEGIDKILKMHRADAIIAPSLTPTFVTDFVMGDGRVTACTLPACTAGYPHLNVPAGFVYGLPVSLSFFGTAWSEPTLLKLGHAFEQATRARRKPQFLPTLEFPIR
jgi:amidase